MSAAPPTYVVDASVAIKWFLEDEDYVEQSQAFLNAYERGAIRLLAPEHLMIEVANPIRSAVGSRRLTTQQGDDAIS